MQACVSVYSSDSIRTHHPFSILYSNAKHHEFVWMQKTKRAHIDDLLLSLSFSHTHTCLLHVIFSWHLLIRLVRLRLIYFNMCCILSPLSNWRTNEIFFIHMHVLWWRGMHGAKCKCKQIQCVQLAATNYTILLQFSNAVAYNYLLACSLVRWFDLIFIYQYTISSIRSLCITQHFLTTNSNIDEELNQRATQIATVMLDTFYCTYVCVCVCICGCIFSTSALSSPLKPLTFWFQIENIYCSFHVQFICQWWYRHIQHCTHTHAHLVMFDHFMPQWQYIQYSIPHNCYSNESLFLWYAFYKFFFQL